MSDTSEKQLAANRENAKLGGVKTAEGKTVSKYNALKHGILRETVSDYEKGFYEDIAELLDEQFKPVGILEKMLVDRIGVYYLKLHRVARAENEFMRSTLNPRIVSDPLADFGFGVEVVNEGYTPTVGRDAVNMLSDTYLRYETTIENRLYKAIHELQRIQSIRNGENISSPVAIDINVSGNGENGFVR